MIAELSAISQFLKVEIKLKLCFYVFYYSNLFERKTQSALIKLSIKYVVNDAKYCNKGGNNITFWPLNDIFLKFEYSRRCTERTHCIEAIACLSINCFKVYICIIIISLGLCNFLSDF